MMNQQLPSPWFLAHQRHSRRWYARESLLVIGCVSLLTVDITLLHFPTRSSDSLLLYLVLIILLALLRGTYTAILASVLSFILFDYLFIAPAFSFQASKYEDVLSLFIFLFGALLTSYLASALRVQLEQRRHKEVQSRLLYQLARQLNRQETLEEQLELFVDYLTGNFSQHGLQNCSFLLARDGSPLHNRIERTAIMQIGKSLSEENRATPLTEQEWQALFQVMQQREDLFVHGTYLIPLQNDGALQGILLLRLRTPLQQPGEQLFCARTASPSSDCQVFFSTLLEYALAIIHKERLRQEQIQYQIMQQSEKLRSALLTSVSHDLRRPLTNIKMAIESLQARQGHDKEEQSTLAAIEHESDWLDSLIENLLDMSRIEAGALRLQTVWYEIEILIYDVLLRMQPSLQNHPVNVDIAEGVPLVKIDTALIDQVLTNLLTNAVSYTPPDTAITIRVEAENQQLILRIIDRGPGIAAAEHERIFEKFYRLKSEHRGNVAGLGLGLSICRSIIEAHHGRIWIEDNPEGGAIFALTLPYAPTAESEIDE